MAEQADVRDAQPIKLPALEKSMHPVTLRFADPVLERHYHDARLRYRFVAGRMSSLAGALAWLAFIVLGILVDREPPPVIRFTTIAACIWMLGMFGLHFLLKPGRWVEIAGVVILLTNFCLLLFLIAVDQPRRRSAILAVIRVHHGGGDVVRAGRRDLLGRSAGSQRWPSPSTMSRSRCCSPSRS